MAGGDGESCEEEILIGRQPDLRPKPGDDVAQARPQAHRPLIVDSAIFDRQPQITLVITLWMPPQMQVESCGWQSHTVLETSPEAPLQRCAQPFHAPGCEQMFEAST